MMVKMKTFFKLKNFPINLIFNVIIINLILNTNLLIGSVMGLKCICNKSECDVIRSIDCPGKGYIVWDPCK